MSEPCMFAYRVKSCGEHCSDINHHYAMLEIQELELERDRYEKALEDIAAMKDRSQGFSLLALRAIARAALKESN